MDSFIEFISRLIYGTGTEAVITPNHRDYMASTPTPTGVAWIARYVTGATSILGVFEDWLRAHNLPPIYPYNGSNLTEWDSGDDANAGLGLPLPSNLQPTSLTFASQEALGVALRDRLIQMQTSSNLGYSADLEHRVKAPYSQRFWGYLKWASLIVRRYDSELVDFRPPLLYDRDGTILSAIPFLNFVNGTHWRWHDFYGNHGQPLRPTITPRGTITPGYLSPVGQRAAAAATNLAANAAANAAAAIPGATRDTINAAANAVLTVGDRIAQNEEFLRFHRDHIQMFHNWLARTGQPQLRHINMLSVWTGDFNSTANRGWPPDGAGNPSTWVETYNRPWTNNESDPIGGARLRDFTTPAALAGAALAGVVEMGTYHAAGHNNNPDIRHPLRNNYHYRFFAWHQFLDLQWFVRAPRFARWNATNGLRERVFRPVLVTTGVPWPGMPALTIVRDPSAPADVVSPANAVSGVDLATGAGTLRMQFVARDTYDRLLRARFRVEVFNDAVSTSTPVETVTAPDRTVGPGGTIALGTDFTVDFALPTAFRSSDPTRTAAAVGFVNSRIRVTGTLAPDDGTDAAFTHEDHIDIDLVQERQAPAVDIFLNLSSFSDNQVASKAAEPDGSKRFRNAVMVTVQDRTERPVPITWPSTIVPEFEALLAPPVPAAGLFDDPARAPSPDLWQPTVDAPFAGLRVELASGPIKEDPTLPDNVPQRYTCFYDVVFDATNGAFTGLAIGAGQRARLRFTVSDRAGNSATSEAGVMLFRDANPYMIDGDPAWLSQDTRVFRIYEGEALFGVTMTADQPNNFIRDLLVRLNDGSVADSVRDGWFASLPTFAGQDVLEFSTTIRTPATGAVRKIYNFTLARIRVQGTSGASRVRAFFRLFTYSGSNLTFEESVGYRIHTDGSRKVPLLGFATTGDVISIPFFAMPRVVSTADMRGQPEDTPNVRDFPPGSTAEQIQYFGAYLDINQDAAALPARRVSDPARIDGTFLVSEIQPIRTTIRDAHQCMAVELRYDGDPTSTGATPFSSDNLAQRNLTILRSDNPGSPITRTVEHSFEADTRCPGCEDEKHDHQEGHHHEPIQALAFIATRHDAERAARQALAPTDFSHVHVDEGGESEPESGHEPRHDGEHSHGTEHDHGREHDHSAAIRSFPFVFDGVDWKSTGDLLDELIFVWNGLPEESRVEIFLPGVRAENIINLRNLRHAPRDVRIIDENRLFLVPNGVTYVPLPPTPEERVAGVVTITLPDGIKHGERWTVDVIQLRGHEQRALGGFQLDVRVEKDLTDMAEAERRLLETLFERRSLLARYDRWRPILEHRVETARARARALAERAGIAWNDPTQWTDPNDPTKSYPFEGSKIRVILEKIQILDASEPWFKGKGEIRFNARVRTSNNGGIEQRTVLPEKGVYSVSDKAGQNMITINQALFHGFVSDNLSIEIVGIELDTFDPDDDLGKYTRLFDCSCEELLRSYEPDDDGPIDPEDVGRWRVWYRIERG